MIDQDVLVSSLDDIAPLVLVSVGAVISPVSAHMMHNKKQAWKVTFRNHPLKVVEL